MGFIEDLINKYEQEDWRKYKAAVAAMENIPEKHHVSISMIEVFVIDHKATFGLKNVVVVRPNTMLRVLVDRAHANPNMLLQVYPDGDKVECSVAWFDYVTKKGQLVKKLIRE